MTGTDSAHARIAAHWTPGKAPDRTLADDTRALLQSTRPGDREPLASQIGRAHV